MPASVPRRRAALAAADNSGAVVAAARSSSNSSSAGCRIRQRVKIAALRDSRSPARMRYVRLESSSFVGSGRVARASQSMDCRVLGIWASVPNNDAGSAADPAPERIRRKVAPTRSSLDEAIALAIIASAAGLPGSESSAEKKSLTSAAAALTSAKVVVFGNLACCASGPGMLSSAAATGALSAGVALAAIKPGTLAALPMLPSHSMAMALACGLASDAMNASNSPSRAARTAGSLVPRNTAWRVAASSPTDLPCS